MLTPYHENSQSPSGDARCPRPCAWRPPTCQGALPETPAPHECRLSRRGATARRGVTTRDEMKGALT
eukprot:9108743-Pyramimonas_sp.AAC.1